MRAGTENMPAIIGAGVAMAAANTTRHSAWEHAALLQTKLRTELAASVPDLRWIGPSPGDVRLPHILGWSARGVEGEALVLAADLKQVALGAGPACISRALRVSHVLKAMGWPQVDAVGQVQATLSRLSTVAEIDYALQVLPPLIAKIREMNPMLA
jgi:cysteine desulfurase